MFKINNLTYKYDKNRKALDNVTMDFDKGDIIGIIGSNGSGKSTLFNNLMGILKATEGEILYKKNRLKYNKKSLISNISSSSIPHKEKVLRFLNWS